MPLHRVFFRLSDGVHLAFPGAAGLLKDAGPSEHAADELGAEQEGMRWGKPRLDPLVGGMLITCSAPLYDEAARFRGIVGVDVDISRLGDELDLKLAYVDLAMLVARDGTVMTAQGSDTSAVAVGDALAMPALTEAMKAGKAGNIETTFRNRRVLVTYYPLHTVEWYFVAVANLGSMMETAEEAAPVAPWARAPVKPTAMAASAPPVAPVPSATISTAAPDGGDEDADGGVEDAGAVQTADAGSRLPLPAGRVPLPGPSGAAPPPTDSSTAIPKNPFDKWDVYQKGKAPEPNQP